jgi:hypothetical protein
MFEFLKEYLNILKSNIDIDHRRHKTYLMNIIMINNFSLHFMYNIKYILYLKLK